MSLTKSTLRLADAGNFERSRSAAAAPGHADNAFNINPTGMQAPGLTSLRRAESIWVMLRISIGVCFLSKGCMAVWTAVNRRKFTAELRENSALAKDKQVITGQP